MTRANDERWRQYDLAQRHYESDLALLVSRANLFIAIDSVLLAGAATAVSDKSTFVGQHRGLTTVFGIAISLIWFAVVVSSYTWILAWRGLLTELSKEEPPLSSTIVDGFSRYRHEELVNSASQHWKVLRGPTKALARIGFYVRPTGVIAFLIPLVFIIFWLIFWRV